MNRLFLFMTILVLGVPVYAQSEKRRAIEYRIQPNQ